MSFCFCVVESGIVVAQNELRTFNSVNLLCQHLLLVDTHYNYRTRDGFCTCCPHPAVSSRKSSTRPHHGDTLLDKNYAESYAPQRITGIKRLDHSTRLDDTFPSRLQHPVKFCKSIGTTVSAGQWRFCDSTNVRFQKRVM
jgi:hypothetical protein